MNERIQELANQAGLFMDVDGRPWPRDMGTQECREAYQKFAQLIVRECMDVVDPGQNQVIARFQARQYLAEHFGVE